jgi:hypothetical protein
MNLHRRIQLRSLFAQGEGTRIKAQSLMLAAMGLYFVIDTILRFIARSDSPGYQELSRPCVWQRNLLHSRVTLIRLKGPNRLAALSPGITMPRLRGTPRRGAAWYAAKSRRKRKEAFEKALAIATRRRRMRGKAIVEEVLPEAGQENPPEYTWFTAPGHWNSRSCFGVDSTSGMAGVQCNPDDSGNEAPYTPCYVEEEAPPEPTRLDPATHAPEARGDTSPTQPPPPHTDYLSLLFDVRHLLADQVFRIERLEQRLDLFFAAHSRATPKKQCPTCARAYVFPARWRHTEAADALLGSEVT